MYFSNTTCPDKACHKEKNGKRFSGLHLQACGSSLKNEKILNVVNYFQLAYHKKASLF